MDTIVKIRHGSHLYGLNTPASDTDFKGVFLPSLEEIVQYSVEHERRHSTGSNNSKNTNEDVDTVFFSLQKFIKMACDGETIAIDALHVNAENLLESSPIWEEIVANRHRFYTKNMKAFLGYCKKQASKYGIRGSRLHAMERVLACLDTVGSEIAVNERLTHPEITAFLQAVADKYPEYVTLHLNGFEKGGKHINKAVLQVCESKYDMSCNVDYVARELQKKYDSYGHRAQQAKNNEGVDWKALSHALRAGYQLKEIYETGDLQYPLKKAKFLLEVKQGQHDYSTVVAPTLEALVDEVELLAAKSDYPAKVDREWWNNFIARAYIE